VESLRSSRDLELATVDPRRPLKLVKKDEAKANPGNKTKTTPPKRLMGKLEG
jgi:hypothetical protein